MTLVKRDHAPHETRRLELFDRLFDDIPDFFRRPVLLWPERALEEMRMEEFTENGVFVVRLELAGVDPVRDVEICLEGDMLHICAERHEEEKLEARDYVRREFRYGSVSRDVPIPKGVSEKDITATYKDGLLEIRMPIPTMELGSSKKIPVVKAA